MAPKTKKEKLALENFEEALSLLNDPRRRQGIRYPLDSVIIISLMAMVCSADNAEAIQTLGKINEEWLSNKARFSYDSLYIQRLTYPKLNIGGKFIDIS